MSDIQAGFSHLVIVLLEVVFAAKAPVEYVILSVKAIYTVVAHQKEYQYVAGVAHQLGTVIQFIVEILAFVLVE